MCFVSKKYNKRILSSRYYKFATGTRILNLFPRKENQNEIIIDITHISGNIDIVLLNDDNEKQISIKESGTYKFNLELNNHYKLKLILNKHSGNYQIYY